MPRNFDSQKLKLSVVTWKLRGPEFPRVGSYVSDFDTSLISRKCDWEGCNLGIRLNINLCNKPLLFCLMVRQKDVYTCILFFTECTCKRRCVKKTAIVVFPGPVSKQALVEKNNCILDRRETDVLQNKRFVLLIGLVPPMMTAERRRLIEQNILANHVQ